MEIPFFACAEFGDEVRALAWVTIGAAETLSVLIMNGLARRVQLLLTGHCGIRLIFSQV